jgi:hypothetical protein
MDNEIACTQTVGTTSVLLGICVLGVLRLVVLS